MNIATVILCIQFMRCGFYLLEFYGNEAYNLLTNWLVFKTFSYCTDFFFIRNIDVLICVFLAADVHLHQKAARVRGKDRREKEEKRFQNFQFIINPYTNETLQFVWNIHELTKCVMWNIKYLSLNFGWVTDILSAKSLYPKEKLKGRICHLKFNSYN